jgi:hypothetical protein
MRIPGVNDRFGAGLPARALRAAYRRAGRFFMYADRLRSEGREREAGGRAEGGGRAAGGASRWRSLDQTGNVRLLRADEAGAAEPVTPPDAEPVTRPAAEPAATERLPALAAAPGEAGLPVPNYDALSLPSLRARLRSLDVAQLRVLAEYERAHAGRLDVVMMFERRIARLGGQQDGA